ncbi:hypothetical protein HYH03_009639 [Edaphochlamys debaryana]|uniref:Laccase n=1 Tax=Edaphochlamys debaryana TaxID=47281 RepID=A0A836BYC0_9CHLO|nr:hypothetical protein HYH03_009639 [Edaphochlamys debaryana]|eukprot:KAG2492148.1 hypothetical protein HYH03_009639 [Edaphochlamys debaryana]
MAHRVAQVGQLLVLFLAYTARSQAFSPIELEWEDAGRVDVPTSGADTISVPLFKGTLSYRPATVAIDGWIVNTMTYGFGKSLALLPGPTLRLRACAQYRLRLVNEAAEPWTDVSTTTNLHIHGVHVNGDAPADDVTVSVAAGQSYTYIYNIPCDHAGGTFFYHPHVHMQTALQVAGGAVGTVIVDDHPGEAASRPAAWPDMGEHVLVRGGVLLRVDAASSPGSMAAMMGGRMGDLMGGASLPKLCDNVGCKWFSSLGSPPAPSFYLANGRYKPTLPLGAANTWHRLRLVHASLDSIASPFKITAASGQGAGACSVSLLAKDGVLLPSTPRPLGPGTGTTTPLLFANAATRADVALSCPCTAGTCTYNVMHHDAVVATLAVTATSAPVAGGVRVGVGVGAPPPPLPAWRPCRPWYLRDLRHETVGGTFAAHVGPTGINGVSFSAHAPVYTFEPRSEWTLRGIDMHPVHLHATPFQIVGGVPVGAPAGWFELGDWHDTVTSGGMMERSGVMAGGAAAGAGGMMGPGAGGPGGGGAGGGGNPNANGNANRNGGGGMMGGMMGGMLRGGNGGGAWQGMGRRALQQMGMGMMGGGGGMMSGFSTVVRFRTEFACKVMLHCHILTHEDAGSMALTRSLGPGGIGPHMMNPATDFACPT